MNNIKYHQNGTGNEYGADGSLTNNWDTMRDYQNEYINVYFRINTPTYDYNTNFDKNEDREAWRNEIETIIESFGILESCSYNTGKREYLHAHPQNISGVILKNKVVQIAEAINNMNLSSIRWVDLYDTVYNISDEEYNSYLSTKQAEVKSKLFEACETTRTSKYYSIFDVARQVANSVRLKRLGLNDGVNYGSGQTIDYIITVAEKMVDDGMLKCFVKNEQKFVRSLNKTEQKKVKNIDSYFMV